MMLLKIKKSSLSKLTIQESLLQSVPAKALSVLEGLEYFAMVNSEIPVIEAKAFDSLKSANVLRVLNLQNNYIKTIGVGAFAKLTALRTLILKGNEIATIVTGTLPPSNLMKFLDISINRLGSVPADISTLPYESSVNLNDNAIETVSGIALRTMVTNHLSMSLIGNNLRCTCSMRILTSTTIRSVFGTCGYPSKLAGKSLTNLTTADFSGCYLLASLRNVTSKFFENMLVRDALLYGRRWSEISDDAFVNQENSLSKLTIEESLLRSVPLKALSILQNLEYFAMVHSEVSKIGANAFDSLKSVDVLKTLNLENNYIQTIGTGAFAKLSALRTLILSGNEITTIPSSTLPPNNLIKVFDVSDNQLESVPADINTLPYGSSVNLDYNTIRIVSGISLRTMVANHLSTSMQGNGLRCTCSMRILTSTAERSVYGTCAYPSRLSGKSLKNLTAADFSSCYFLYNVM
ncbi:Slit 3 protein [Nymphon striatum]|nr:Slit 3 protein [Nymphon striatum]